MMDEQTFNELVDAIMRLGYDEETAAHYAFLIGDLVHMEDGKVVVMEDGRELARLHLPDWFD